MIIVSQNKRIMTESLELSIEDIEDENAKKIMVESNCGKLYFLGKYATEERAKEVLKEIAKKYENSMWKLGKNTLSFQDEFVYEMPRE